MAVWCSNYLGDAIVAQSELNRIEMIFADKHRKAGKPLEMAVFMRYDAEGGLHCRVTAYFSPAAKDIARCVEARPCPRPLSCQIELFAGKEESWSVLFSQEKT